MTKNDRKTVSLDEHSKSVLSKDQVDLLNQVTVKIESPSIKAIIILAPIITYGLLIVFFLLSIVLLIASGYIGGKIILISKTLIMLMVLISIPKIVSIASKAWHWNQVMVALTTTVVATLVIIVYIMWFLESNTLGLWAIIPFLLMLLLFSGTSLFQFMVNKIIKRLVNASQFTLAPNEITRLQNTVSFERLFYIAIPLGLIIATSYGVLGNYSGEKILAFQSLGTLSSLTVSLVILLIASAFVMSDSLILLVPSEETNSVVQKKRNTVLEKIVVNLKIRLFSQTTDTLETNANKSVDMAYLVCDLRRIYFYDSIHNLILLLGFLITIMSQINVSFVSANYILWIIISLLLTFIFCFLPFTIGQHRLHETVLDFSKSEGVARKELIARLMDASPLYPKSDFISALVSTGTAGGIISALIYEVLKNAIK